MTLLNCIFHNFISLILMVYHTLVLWDWTFWVDSYLLTLNGGWSICTNYKIWRIWVVNVSKLHHALSLWDRDSFEAHHPATHEDRMWSFRNPIRVVNVVCNHQNGCYMEWINQRAFLSVTICSSLVFLFSSFYQVCFSLFFGKVLRDPGYLVRQFLEIPLPNH